MKTEQVVETHFSDLTLAEVLSLPHELTGDKLVGLEANGVKSEATPDTPSPDPGTEFTPIRPKYYVYEKRSRNKHEHVEADEAEEE